MRRALTWLCLLAGGVLAAQAAWLPAKAALAQQLLERAWRTSRVDGGAHRPWPWADVAPVARLEVPRLGVTRIVLAGDSGRALAFAPGWSESSALPGRTGLSVVSAHRDTHFRFLRELVAGDRIIVEHARGERAYRVASMRVVDTRDSHIALDADADALLLVTCWPFDALAAQGPLRYLVEARPWSSTDQDSGGFVAIGAAASGRPVRDDGPSRRDSGPSSAPRPGRGGRAESAFQRM